MNILLLIAAIATLSAWLAGFAIKLAGKALDFQAHSAKVTNALSVVYLGREVIKKQLVMSYSQFIDAVNALSKMIINTQLDYSLVKIEPLSIEVSISQ